MPHPLFVAAPVKFYGARLVAAFVWHFFLCEINLENFFSEPRNMYERYAIQVSGEMRGVPLLGLIPAFEEGFVKVKVHACRVCVLVQGQNTHNFGKLITER